MENFPRRPYCIFTSPSTKHFQSNSLCQHLSATTELLPFLTPFRIQRAETQIQSIMDCGWHSLNAAQYTRPQHQQWDWYKLNSGENPAFTNHFEDNHVTGFRRAQILTNPPLSYCLNSCSSNERPADLNKKMLKTCIAIRTGHFSPFLCKSLNEDKAILTSFQFYHCREGSKEALPQHPSGV